tara:strand:- start:1910 stop:2113 length:204 start_codon:yes stop_codon:yes gene_type:complete
MDKLEAVQRILRFSPRILEWCEQEHHVFFDDFDPHNVENYEDGYGELADSIINEGIIENIIEEEDID